MGFIPLVKRPWFVQHPGWSTLATRHLSLWSRVIGRQDFRCWRALHHQNCRNVSKAIISHPCFWWFIPSIYGKIGVGLLLLYEHYVGKTLCDLIESSQNRCYLSNCKGRFGYRKRTFDMICSYLTQIFLKQQQARPHQREINMSAIKMGIWPRIAASILRTYNYLYM